jgi:tetratricopeptide (TPR) repeat protein
VDGQYEKAIAAYSQQFEDDGRAPNLINRGLDYLLMGDLACALDDFRGSLTVEPPRFWSSGQFALQGICHWFLDQPEQAVAAWQEAGTAPYTDIAGGVEPSILLLYAAERLDREDLRREALSLLRRHARRKLQTWPGPAVPFLLGKTDNEDLERALAAVSVQLRPRYQCQFDFFVALHAFRTGDIEQFKTHMARCAGNSNGIVEDGYYLARWEVMRNFPIPPF